MQKISLPLNLQGVHLHFVGIKGTGMAALVEIAHKRGAIITGSDVSERFYTDDILDSLKIKALPFSKENITDNVQFVIYSSAYNPEKNPDLAEAVKKQLPMLLYSEALGCLSESAYGCAVCGVHGKTTTTGLVGTILENLPISAQVLAGSVITSFGDTCTMTNSLYSKSETESKNVFVAETCEYQKHFMAFSPHKIILTSVESDHQDFYPTYNDIRDAFVDFVCKLPQGGQLIYCADDNGAVEVAELAKNKRNDIQFIPYGENALGDYKLTFGEVGNGLQHFTLADSDKYSLCVPGRHLVRNATAAIALCTELLKTKNIDITDEIKESILKGLLQFKGGKRRSEVVGKAVNKNGKQIIFIDDYGHHPTAIKTTLAGYKEFFSGYKIIVDFMSHTYSRTQALMDEFASSFESADEVILHKIYSSARENASNFNISGKTLFEKAKNLYKNVYYFEEILDANDFLLKELNSPLDSVYQNGFLFVTMGAGDNWKIGKKLLSDFNKGDK